MIESLLFTIAMVIYWLSEGCTEGYTWAKPKRRKKLKNTIIRRNLSEWWMVTLVMLLLTWVLILGLRRELDLRVWTPGNVELVTKKRRLKD